MKNTLFRLCCLLLAGLPAPVFAADAADIRYEVWFKDNLVATQTVRIVQSDGLKTISTAFEADLPVFIAMHHYSEQLSATCRADGTVTRIETVHQDGPIRTEISADLQEEEGGLQVIRTDSSGTSIYVIQRKDYDFNSLSLYGTAPADFLPTNRLARVLSIADGKVVPVDIQTISESDTFERQHLISTHLVWTEGVHVSHSWHPERFSNLPRRYVRQTDAGEFVFNLIR